VIAIADITGIHEQGRMSVDVEGNRLSAVAYRADLKLFQALKGDCPVNFSIEFYTPTEFVGYPGLNTGLQMIFLKRSGETLLFTDRHYPTLPATKRAEPKGSDLDVSNALDSVVATLGAVLASPTAAPSAKWEVLRVAYALPSSSSFMSSLRLASASATDPELKYRLVAELIARGDLADLPEVGELLLTHALTDTQAQRMLYVIANKLNDPKAVPTLRQLLRSGSTAARRSAAEGLWHVANSATTPDLVRALQDPDTDVRYYAVRGLADINREPAWGPSVSAFRENEAKYLTYWLDWANPARKKPDEN
jgi:hypothetical protein